MEQDTVIQTKQQTTEWEKTFNSYTSDKKAKIKNILRTQNTRYQENIILF